MPGEQHTQAVQKDDDYKGFDNNNRLVNEIFFPFPQHKKLHDQWRQWGWRVSISPTEVSQPLRTHKQQPTEPQGWRNGAKLHFNLKKIRKSDHLAVESRHDGAGERNARIELYQVQGCSKLPL